MSGRLGGKWNDRALIAGVTNEAEVVCDGQQQHIPKKYLGVAKEVLLKWVCAHEEHEEHDGDTPAVGE